MIVMTDVTTFSSLMNFRHFCSVVHNLIELPGMRTVIQPNQQLHKPFLSDMSREFKKGQTNQSDICILQERSGGKV